MKKLILPAALLALLAMSAQAMTPVSTTPVFNGVTSSSQNVILPLGDQNVDYLSVTAAYSSAALATSNFTDGAKSSATLTVKSTATLAGAAGSVQVGILTNTALAAASATNTITIASNTALTGATINVAGSTLTVGNQFQQLTSSAATAVSLAQAINAIPSNRVTSLFATSSFGVVTITCVTPGSYCNTYVLVSSTPTALTAGSAKFTGGVDNSYIKIGDEFYYQGASWLVGASSAATANSVAAFFNGKNGFIASTTTISTVTITCQSVGNYCNSNTVSVSTSAIGISSGLFSGGQNAVSFTIQGVSKVAGIDYLVGASSVTASTAIVAAINADSYLSTIIVATTAVSGLNVGVVYATSTALGVNAWSIRSSSPAILLANASTFGNGSATAIITASNALNLPLHGWATGTPVLFSTTNAKTPPGLLVNLTTYYAYVVDANTIKLSSSYANATSTSAPVFVGISTQAAAGGGTFSLAPLALSSSLLLSWYASDDCINYSPLTLPSNVTVPSVTAASSAAAACTYWDFGQINARCLELKIGGPTAGAYNLTVTPYGKSLANGH